VIIAIFIIFLFIILRFTVTLFNFISNPKLHRVAKQYNDPVSILIPARDEEHNILNLLRSIQQQDYTNYEVIILDDSSSDHTFKVCSDFAANNPRFKVIRGEELPHDWLGKNYACHQLAKHANGDFLLFLDADEKIKDGLINSAVHRMYLRKLGLLSLFCQPGYAVVWRDKCCTADALYPAHLTAGTIGLFNKKLLGCRGQRPIYVV